MKILVTGSKGYLGSSFINQYKGVYFFKNFSLLNKKLDDIDLNGIDVILHCAALVHQKVEYSYEKYYEINVAYPVKLAELAKQRGVRHFIFISTIAVYGEEAQLITENTLCNPVTNYGKSKLEAEKQLFALENHEFKVSVIRAPMVYGKNAPGNIESLVRIVKQFSVLPLGKIQNKRSFVYVGNLCYLINEVIRQEKTGLFLASDDEPISTTRLIELIEKYLYKKVYLIKIPFFETIIQLLKPSFHKRLYGNLEINNFLTRQKLNLKNPYSVEDGIKLMIQGE
ncbi:NAD-dependent epimerase/dehydratase family protein [Sulfurimonas sp. C5]|uniref:NAD-dependent epimerase/dehydratase family protein n=1 Tax=Sulfurimonas sp. C5 TaxID=3036947 RepID=UPI00245579BD|nr:NAD-dependent epimerase/dehydratase family protein [Sulfurimonas sp. C5]MDH4944063.1 NAD-dependent epimerase/dehydratase family protein [Sulfurimonas sp. C5]